MCRLQRTTPCWNTKQGTSLVDISNVGLISQALYAYTAPVYDDVRALEWQAKQVSFISVFNCMGRIIIGMPF